MCFTLLTLMDFARFGLGSGVCSKHSRGEGYFGSLFGLSGIVSDPIPEYLETQCLAGLNWCWRRTAGTPLGTDSECSDFLFLSAWLFVPCVVVLVLDSLLMPTTFHRFSSFWKRSQFNQFLQLCSNTPNFVTRSPSTSSTKVLAVREMTLDVSF